MGVRQDRPFPIQPRANGRMATVLQVATSAALVLGLLAVLLPGQIGRALAWGSVGLVVAAPLARVGWLAVRWVERRDWRYAALAAALLAIVVAGAAIAVVLRP